MKHLRLIIILVILLSFSYTVSAFSISPGKTELYFEPAKKFNISFSINNDYKDAYFFVEPYIENEEIRDAMSDNIKLPEMALITKNTIKGIIVELTLPNFMEPGTYEIKLNVNFELVENIKSKNTLDAKALAYYLVKINVPYRGKYIRAVLKEVDDRNSEKNIGFKISGQSLSTDNINDARAFVKIFKDGNDVETAYSESREILPKETKEFDVIILTENYSIGMYDFETGISYDNLIAGAHGDSFLIGDLNVEIGNLSSTIIKTGVINKLDLYLKNEWNKDVDGVYAVISLYDELGETIKFRSETINLKSWSWGTLPIFIDASDIKEGTYSLGVVVYFKEKSNSKLFDISASDELSFPAGFRGVNGKMIVLLLGIILIITIFNFYFFFKLKNKEIHKEDRNKPGKNEKR